MTRLLLIVFNSLLAAQAPHQHHPPSDAREYARILNDPAREAWQKPDAVITALRIKPSDAIADIGAGSGYFARRFVEHAAKVYAVDISADLLKIAADGAPKNLVTVLAAADDPKLPPSSVDLIFFCDVMHHIENRPAYYRRLNTALKPGGRIVNIDFYKKDLPVGPPVSMKLSEEQVIDEFKAAGFKLARKHDMLPYQYFLEFERAE
ncbi:MAG TPA: class I SAM-dependent methyltransferase [Bryobacteraceae bacterium]|jgi:ubiquinone/menaquinone biosynthesis C-methylase UbiE